ncbi:hypothetical protein FEM48_Zijuj02G0097800 [Ziziphus jujuba var. spinosa]|uniref:Kiwellin-like n=1 Tax=Ziziphus jujuba var. spinosa TaxID=714518 RepID=A0A978VV16_ZIZJJ|nr:hypothetical protein FEM48_Zijuj02G0097800 [Ziziphus jujuba var. spinosa]
MITFLVPATAAISSCKDPCRTLDDCEGQLICIKGKCNDDPELGTHTCRGRRTSPSPSTGIQGCHPFGTLKCNGKSHPTYRCSPPVTTSTRAKLMSNDFSEGGDGGGPSACDGQYHDNKEMIVALSTGWYNGGLRCGKMIRITASNGRSTMAKVVDECDSMHGCDAEHAYQGPCDNDTVNGSDTVWSALGIDTEEGVANVTWSMVS